MCLFVVFAVIWLIENSVCASVVPRPLPQPPIHSPPYLSTTEVYFMQKKIVFMGIFVYARNGSFACFWGAFLAQLETRCELVGRMKCEMWNAALRRTKEQEQSFKNSEPILMTRATATMNFQHLVLKAFHLNAEKIKETETNPSKNRLITQPDFQPE